MLRRTAWGCCRTSNPFTTPRPAVGCSTVVSMRTIVVLPAPLAPSRPNTVPRGTAGGITNWMRSPLGSVADNSGVLTDSRLTGLGMGGDPVLGGALGFLIVIAIAMFGIGALLTVFPDLLVVLKWVGGAYLVYLGVMVWRAPAITVAASTDRPTASRWSRRCRARR